MPSQTTTATPMDAIAPATSEYIHDLHLSRVVKHPKNPRHKATADAELIASVQASGLYQPLVVAPAYDEYGIALPDQYVLIAGHRRMDALKKAKRKTGPAIIRRDLSTEGQQIEAMLVENGRREDLTPVEEAEGYAQLELIGYKPAAIAKAVGRDVTTVRSRMKLLKLSTSTRKKVHAGQLTLDDAAALVEFADDPDTTKRLEKAAQSTDSWSFKHAITTARRVRNTEREHAARVAKLLDAGAAEIALKEGESAYSIAGADLQRLEQTHSTDWGQHTSCLAFVRYTNEYSGPQLVEFCNNPTSHREQLDEQAQQAQAEQDARVKAAEERSLAEAAASDRRVDTLMGLTDGAAVPAPLADIAKTMLPALLRHLSGADLVAYQHAMGIRMEDRWAHLGYHHTKPTDRTRFNEHCSDLADGGAALITRALTALLVAAGERVICDGWSHPDLIDGIDYLDLLAEAGHAFGDVDTETRNEIQAKLDKKEHSA